MGTADPTTLYICDLDGTLLGPDARLSEFAAQGLNQLLGSGVALTIATSRRTVSIRSVMAAVDLRLPVIELNGAFVSDLASGRRLSAHLLDPETAKAVIETMTGVGADPVITAWDGDRDRIYFTEKLNAGSAWFANGKRKFGNTDLIERKALPPIPAEERVAAITGFVPDRDGAELKAQLTALVGDRAAVYCAPNYYCPGWTEVQIQDTAADKGAAIPSLLAAAGLQGAEVIGCGDHLNDLGLFAAAAHSIAPANAHPAVLACAGEVVGSNVEDGVVRHLLDRQV